MTRIRNSTTTTAIDIAIIGGGASGMTAAIAAQNALIEAGNAHGNIVIFERNDRLGKKLLATGNGRCNLSNKICTPKQFHGEETAFLRNLLTRFTPEAIEKFFSDLGLICTTEDRKIFPASLHSSSVLDTLRLGITEREVTVRTGIRITGIRKNGRMFLLKCADGSTHHSRTVIVATGGKCAPATGSDGNGYRLLESFSHRLIPPAPSIVQLRTETNFVKPLSGQKIQGVVSLRNNGKEVRTESGEILFTDYGLSGPPVLQLSGHVARALNATGHGASPTLNVSIDFLPSLSNGQLIKLLTHRRKQFSSRRLEEFLTGLFHRRLAYGILKKALGKPLSTLSETLTDEDLSLIAGSCKQMFVKVEGTQPFAHAQTTAGGIAINGFERETLQSLACPGLYACGEVLDIDGDCGGYNLHWAWASGIITGESAAAFCLGDF